MKKRNKIREIAYASVFTALVTMFVILGGVFDILDLICVGLATLTVHIALRELPKKYVFMIYAASAVLSLLLMPLRTASLYFAAFFGYFPLLRDFAVRRFPKKKLPYYLIIYSVYNVTMGLIFVIFRELFGLQNEPPALIVVFILSVNVYLFSFDMFMNVAYFLYDHRIKKAYTKSKRTPTNKPPKEISHDHTKRDL